MAANRRSAKTKGRVGQLLAVMNERFKRVEWVGAIVIHHPNQGIAATGGELFLHDRNEFGRRPPIFFATQNAEVRKRLGIIGDGIGLLLSNGKLRKRENDFIRWTRLVEQTADGGLEISDAVRQRGYRSDDARSIGSFTFR